MAQTDSGPLADTEIAAKCERIALPLSVDADLDPLIERIGEARYVLLGEASHGTAEYYTWRARISRRLILEKNFSFIAVEGDWPDCYCVNRYIKSYTECGRSAEEVLHAFSRWPTWMWANREIVDLAEWLRSDNAGQDAQRQIGFYGLDMYSLWESLQEIMRYLEQHDGEALSAAKRAYHCFEPFHDDVFRYAQAATALLPQSCEPDVLQLLAALHRDRSAPDPADREAHFVAEQNAYVVKNAETYYRIMMRGGPASWNLRDSHMADTLERLMKWHGPHARAIVWEHNTHIGDARATDMAVEGMHNIGQIVRERHGERNVYAVGFGSHHGSVIAGSEWGAPMRRMHVPEARPGSWEDLLHRAQPADKLLLLSELAADPDALEPRGHRAIGVVYHSLFERYGNYVPSILPRRYDAFLFLDETRALHPLHIVVQDEGEPPETFPWSV